MYEHQCNDNEINVTQVHYTFYEEHENDGAYDPHKPAYNDIASLVGNWVQVVFGWV